MSATAQLLPPAPAVSQQAFRNAMARLGAGVNIITTDGPHGRAGFTATAVCSVTDSPASLLVCLNQSASVYPVFLGNGVLCVNVLQGHHSELSNLFGGKTDMDTRFTAGDWQPGESGAPQLTAALVSFDCRISQALTVGTHDILVCDVLAVTGGEPGSALVYFDRAYHTLDQPS